ncbi:MAG: hypothetical protein EHM14_15615 [Methanothrix sp.]|nr:MAG: hypothetical protein EHM14_15615 [Methanothrix sp.]
MPPSEEAGKRKAYADELPSPPDPRENGARFLGWIKKRGFNATYEECDAYCSPLGMDLKNFVKEMGPDLIIVGRTSGGIVIVKVMDRRWASIWARNYGYDLPHHSHRMKL